MEKEKPDPTTESKEAMDDKNNQETSDRLSRPYYGLYEKEILDAIK